MPTDFESNAAAALHARDHAMRTPALRRATAWRHLTYVVAMASLSACAIAPGMKMNQPAVLAIAHPAGAAKATTVQVALTPIDLGVIRREHERAEGADGVTLAALFDSANSPSYPLGPGDVLQITLWDHPEVSAAAMPVQQTPNRTTDPMQGFVIDGSGDLTFPYAGTLHVAGLDVEQVRRRLVEALTPAYRAPQLTVRVVSYRARHVYIDGEVGLPGTVSINDVPMSLVEAVSRAGGFNANADEGRLELVRHGKSYSLDLPAMIEHGRNPARLMLRDGDTLRVFSRAEYGVSVMGEVNHPVMAIPTRSGRLTLSEALAQAGSINSALADAAQVYVLRGALERTPEVFHLNAHSPVAMMLANDFPLEPKDVVYVDGNGLVRFSRVLNLLLPGINAGIYGAAAGK